MAAAIPIAVAAVAATAATASAGVQAYSASEQASASRRAQRQSDDQAKRAAEAAAKQEEAIRTAPKAVGAEDISGTRRRAMNAMRSGFASTIATGARGLGSPAQTASPTLLGGSKTLLGQ